MMMAAEYHFAKGMIKPLAALVVAMALGLSYLQKLGLEREMAYRFPSAVHFQPPKIFSVYVFTVCIAGHKAGQRAKRVPNGKYIAGASIFAGTSVTMLALVLLRIFPFTPRYIIPVAGMMNGNSMTVTEVTMKQLRDDIKSQINQVETALALGATPNQAIVQQVKRALVIGLLPALDTAKAMALIMLPGTMTGLIIGGASPLEAIQLQIVVMNLLVCASTVSSITSTYLTQLGFFTYAHPL